MDWIAELRVPIFLVLTFVITIIGCFLALYAFHAVTKGHHFREWREFEPLDTPLPKVITSRNYDACVALIQGRLQTMFPDAYAKYAHIMCGDWFVERVAAEYFGHEQSKHRVNSLANRIMKITPHTIDTYNKLKKATTVAIEFIANSKS